MRTTCPYDGAALGTTGKCADTGGYPYGTTCPFACPICRQPLEWSGACYACRGQRHAGDPLTMPGDRYDLFDDTGKRIGDGQHWILTAYGPTAAISPEQANQIRALLRRLVGEELSVAAVFEHWPPDGRPA